MTKPDLICAVAERAGISKKEAQSAVNTVFDVLFDTLAEGEKISVIGFGSFDVRQRAERLARNPRTGESITVAATKVPVFTASSVLKKAVAGEE